MASKKLLHGYLYDINIGGSATLRDFVTGGTDYRPQYKINLSVEGDVADWEAAIPVGQTQTIRVSLSGQAQKFYDFVIDRNGILTTVPTGWSGVGTTLSGATFFRGNPNTQPPVADPVSSLTNVSSFPVFNPPVPTTDPPASPAENFATWQELVRNTVQSTTGVTQVIYAYPIETSGGIYTNPPGWTPNWKIFDPDNTGFGYIAGDGTGPIDQQMSSIFCRRAIVTQTDYSIDVEGVYVRNEGIGIGDPPGSKVSTEVTATFDTTITITVNPGLCVDGIDVIRPSKKIDPFPPILGGGTATPTSAELPPVDGGDGSGNNRGPIQGYPGLPGGGTPVPTDYIYLEVQPDPMIFDDTDVGTQRSKAFTVRNGGTVPATVTQIVNNNVDNPFSFGMNAPKTIPFTINPEEILSGIAYFLPANDVFYDEIGLLLNGSTTLASFVVAGNGTLTGNPGDPILRSISLIGDVTTNGDRNFLERTIGTTTTTDIFAVNTGSTPVILNSVTLGGSDRFDSTGVPAGFNLQPGQSLAIPVTFSPIVAQQSFGTFTLNSNAETSPQSGFDPLTGDITASLTGEGVTEPVLNRIMAFNVENNGTFPDVLAGGSASSEITATITNIGNASLLISQFQVESPFTLNLDVFGGATIGSFQFYSLNNPLIIAPQQTTQPFTLTFSPPTATNYVDDVLVVSNKTIGPESFEVRGFGTFEVPDIEPPPPPGPPDDEPPPGQEFDPGTVPSSDLDGIGSACIPKECEVTYLYEYSSNGKIVT